VPAAGEALAQNSWLKQTTIQKGRLWSRPHLHHALRS
jgi:hypothetical protein